MGWWKRENLPTVEKPISVDTHSWIHEKIDGFYEYVPLTTPNKQELHSVVNKFHWNTSHSVIIGTVSLISFSMGVRVGKIRPVWRQVKALQDLHSSEIGPHAPWLRGTAVSVSDGDTIRFFHRPLWWSPMKPANKEDRLAIRICTIDTPETAKFGKPGQPFGEEAKQYLTNLCLNKTVKIQILQVDQYGRGVAQVVRPRLGGFWKMYMDEAMIQAGFAEVYQGTGAVYGRLGKENYIRLMEKAERKKIGMWKLENRETAAEYKQRTKS